MTSSLASRLSRIVRILSESYGKVNHYLYKAAILSVLATSTFSGDSVLHLVQQKPRRNLCIVKSIHTVLNFCGLPENQTCYKEHVSMETRLTISLREEQPVQHAKHSKPKIMNPFVKGGQPNLEDFTALLSKLYIACVHLVKLQLK